MTIRFAVPVVLALAVPSLATAATELAVDAPITLSTQTPDYDLAAKVKLLRMGNGTLVSVYGDAATSQMVYDVKAQKERQARDIFVRTCNPNMVDCSDIANWSAPVNLSNTAGSTSASTMWKGPDGGALPFYGDSDKPNAFNNGPAVVVTWVDKYCDGAAQGSISYPELEEREIPFSCVYTVRSLNNGTTWSAAQRLTTGARDAKADANKGATPAWIITWQEDPIGLQLGQAEGPGDGASGAKVSKGTDIWYSYLSRADFDAGNDFAAPIRITNNFTKLDKKQGTTTDIEGGNVGASRPNIALIGPTVLLAYEETKGLEGLDDGKYIRYHSFPFSQPPTSCEDPGPGCLVGPNGDEYPDADDPKRVGCILSQPDENSRRVRFFAQGTAGPTSGTMLYIFWKQGEFDQGGPSDIMGRRATGFTPADFVPAVAVPTAVNPGDTLDGCLIRGEDDPASGAFTNVAANNLSGATPTGGDLAATTSANDFEDARAHRGLISGDFIVMGYSYTPDWAVARFTDQENYNFWVRTSADGGTTWTTPVDLSSGPLATLAADLGLGPKGVNVKEPRIVKTPGNGPGCPTGDPADPTTTRASDCRAPGTFIVALGAETNVYEHVGGALDLDLFITRSTDKGATYERVVKLAAGRTNTDQELESQLRPTPDGKTVYAVWNEVDDLGAANSLFATAVETDVADMPDAGPMAPDAGTPDPGPDAGTDDEDPPTGDDDDGCGCRTSPGLGGSAMTLFAMAGLWFALGRRRRRR